VCPVIDILVIHRNNDSPIPNPTLKTDPNPNPNTNTNTNGRPKKCNQCDQCVQCDRPLPGAAGHLVWRAQASGPIKRGTNYI